MKLSFFYLVKEFILVLENEGVLIVLSFVILLVLFRRYYGEFIINIGKVSILGNFFLVFFINEYKYFLYRYLILGYLGIFYVL